MLGFPTTERPQVLQKPSRRRMSDILWDGRSKGRLPALHGETGQSTPDKLVATMAALAIQADHKDKGGNLLQRLLERRGAPTREGFLRGTGQAVLRVMVDGAPVALLDRRSSAFGVRTLVVGVDEQGVVGARYWAGSREGDNRLEGALIGDVDLPVSLARREGDSWQHVAKRMGALVERLQTAEGVTVDVMHAHTPAATNRAPGRLAEAALPFHLEAPHTGAPIATLSAGVSR